MSTTLTKSTTLPHYLFDFCAVTCTCHKYGQTIKADAECHIGLENGNIRIEFRDNIDNTIDLKFKIDEIYFSEESQRILVLKS